MAAVTAKKISHGFQSLKAADVFCYICRGILIEPITVPCKHVFCKSCLEDSIPETSYSCPLCRRRISNWLRSAKKCDKLLNTELWEQIQLQYKDEVSAKLSGQDDGLDGRLQEDNHPCHLISPRGEIGSEYSKMVEKFQEEMRQVRDKEERASMELIARLQREELREKEEEERASISMIYRLSREENEPIAKPQSVRNSSHVVKVTPSTSSARKPSKKSAKKEKIIGVGPMDYHIKRLTSCEPAPKLNWLQKYVEGGRCVSTESNDSIASEMHYFKPIRIAPKTPPKKSPDGIVQEVPLRKITPVKLFTESNLQSSNAIANDLSPSSIHSKFSAFKGKPMAQKMDDSSEPVPKKSKYSGTDPESGVLKEINFDENSDSNSMGLSKNDHADGKGMDDVTLGLKLPKIGAALVGEENFSDISQLFDPEEQLRLEQRILQEKADHELALKLSYERYDFRAPRQTTLIAAVTRRRRKN